MSFSWGKIFDSKTASTEIKTKENTPSEIATLNAQRAHMSIRTQPFLAKKRINTVSFKKEKRERRRVERQNRRKIRIRKEERQNRVAEKE